MMKHTKRFAIAASLTLAVSATLLTSCDMMFEAADDYTPIYGAGINPGGLNVNISSGWSAPTYPWYNWNSPYWPTLPPAQPVGPPTRPGGNFRPSTPPQNRPPQQLSPTRPGQGEQPQQPSAPTGQRPGTPGRH